MIHIIVPLIIAFIPLHAFLCGVDIFPVFSEGVRRGMKTVLTIIPTMIGMMTAICMLRASGAIDWLAALAEPIFSLLGIPVECAALVLLKPLSGGGGMALGSEIMRVYGVDSYAGRTAAVMLGASETSIYTINLYAGAVGLNKTRYAIPAALLGDLAAFVTSAWMTRILFDG